MADAPAATFVFADLAGFTALTAAHGDEHAADTAAAFASEIRQLLADYEADAIKSIGDALLIRAPGRGSGGASGRTDHGGPRRP